jgi:hypothetical protein
VHHKDIQHRACIGPLCGQRLTDKVKNTEANLTLQEIVRRYTNRKRSHQELVEIRRKPNGL